MATQVLTPTAAPDISYTPDKDKYLARVARRTQEPLTKELPPGFPASLNSDLVWTGESVGNRDWVYELNTTEIAEIEDAVAHFKSLGKSLGFVNQETFPLPHLHKSLRGISREVHQGRGFKVVRGLPIDRPREEQLLVVAGVSSHVASIRGRQDHQLQGRPADVVLAHIKDLTSTVDAKSIGAPAYTRDGQVFHTDAGDIIALACLETAAEGGESKLSSSWTVYNELATKRPDLIGVLSQPWPAENFSGKGEKYSLRPLLHHVPAADDQPERLIIQYARRTFTGYWGLPRSTDIPPISEAQAEALDALHFLAEKNSVSLDFQKGDIQYVNNLSIFHSRDGFKNSEEKQRHLVRLWLRDEENAWPTPDELKSRWAGLYDGVSPENSVFPLEPAVRSAAAGQKLQ